MATINYGNIRFNWRGEYNENTNYRKDDVVKYKESSYVALQNSKGANVTDKNYWDKMVDGVENQHLVNQLSEKINDIKNKTRVVLISETYKESRLSNPAESIFIYVRDDKVVGCHNLHNDKPIFYITSDGYFEVNGVKIPNINEVFKLGDFRLYPFPPNELPAGWYLRNGDRHSSDSNIGKALKSLSAEYRRLWGIVEIDGYINLPNAFNANGDGYFERPVNGINRRVGSVQGDAIRNITGKFGMINEADVDNGIFYRTTGLRETMRGDGGASNNAIGIDISRTMPTSHENRPLNIGMTPAIYLGV